MKTEKLKVRYLVTSEKDMNHPGNRIVGSAYQTDGDDHMTIHLRILPGTTFFLAPNNNGFPEYIVFSGRARKETGGLRFFHSIGSGFKTRDLSGIEVHLPDLTQTYYIQLDPMDYHGEQPKAAA